MIGAFKMKFLLRWCKLVVVIDATVQHPAETTACGRRFQCSQIIGMAIEVRGVEIRESQTAAKIAK